MELDTDSKLDLIIAVCHKCADIMKDPCCGKADMNADARTKAREEAYDDLLIAIDTLAANCSYNSGIFDVINIASKLKIDIDNDIK